MTDKLPKPAIVIAIVVLIVCGLGYEIHSFNDNGERPNPNAGHPHPSGLKGLSRKGADNMDEDTYLNNLKINRPELSDSERQAMADRWWKIRSGQAHP